MSGLPLFTLLFACPFSNTHEIHLRASYEAATSAPSAHGPEWAKTNPALSAILQKLAQL